MQRKRPRNVVDDDGGVGPAKQVYPLTCSYAHPSPPLPPLPPCLPCLSPSFHTSMRHFYYLQDTIKGTQCYRCLITVRTPPSNHVIDGSVLNMAFGKNKAGSDRLNSVMGTTRAGYCHMFLTFNKMRPETVLNAVKCYHTVPLTAVKMDYRSGYESGDGDEIYVKKKDDGSGNPNMDIERTVTYGIIIQDRDNASNFFFKWQLPGASSSSSTTKIRRLLETDMIPSSFNPICSKQQRAMHTKNLSNAKLGGKISFLCKLIYQLLTFFFRGCIFKFMWRY